MDTTSEARLSKILSWTFRILFGLGFVVFAFFGAIAVSGEKVTKPSGWFTPSEYQDASLVHSCFWLFVFVFIYAIVIVFLCVTVPLYGLIAFIFLAVWLCRNLAASVRTAQAYGGREAVNFFIAKTAVLKQQFVVNQYAFQKRAMLKKILCALIIGGVITQFFSLNPIALLFMYGLHTWGPTLQVISDIVGVGSIAACVFMLLMF